MELTVFQAFPELMQTYTFLELGQGGIYGNGIISETQAEGIFKTRKGLLQNGNVENLNSTSTLHIKPTESFIATVNGNLIGHGIRFGGSDYRIEGLTGGKPGPMSEHYTLTLKAVSLANV